MNYKRKSVRRFFLLMRSKIPRISSEFRGFWAFNPPPPRYATGPMSMWRFTLTPKDTWSVILRSSGRWCLNIKPRKPGSRWPGAGPSGFWLLASRPASKSNCLAVAYLVLEFKPNSASRKFDKLKPDCKLSGKCLVFLFQHPNYFKTAEFRTPTPQDVQKKGSKILKLPRFTIVSH